MADDRLPAQLRFIVEIDRLKSVLRRTWLIDGTRRENSAEHSWHIALMAMLLAEHAPEGLSLPRVMRMLLVHDLVEIDAGDTFAYDVAGNRDRALREQAAADRLFGILPADQARDLRELWDEFEEGATADAVFALALDRLQPLLLGCFTSGDVDEAMLDHLVESHVGLRPTPRLGRLRGPHCPAPLPRGPRRARPWLRALPRTPARSLAPFGALRAPRACRGAGAPLPRAAPSRAAPCAGLAEGSAPEPESTVS